MMKVTLGLGALLLPAVMGCGIEAGAAGDLGADAPPETAQALYVNKAFVGQKLFFDANLSTPAGQSCATCHDQYHAFTDPDLNVPTSEGVIPGRFGNRNSPSAAYARYSPAFHFDSDDGTWVGGQFWDGRASSLEEQAKGPFLNPIEMNNPDKAAVVNKVKASAYAVYFRAIFGAASLDDVESAYDHIAEAIAAFERTATFAPFSSKYDAYLAGTAALTPAEARGLALFEAPDKGNCAACHPSRPAADGTPPLFTDFTYDNIGLPKNYANRFYTEPAFNPAGFAFKDRGLGATVDDPSLDGAFKVPTLRNVSHTAPYMHNGVFLNLATVVHFYNTRDTGTWTPPEFPATMNTEELGALGLTQDEENDLTMFLLTLSDGWVGP